MIPVRNLKRLFYKTARQPGYAFRVFTKRLAAYMHYLFGDGKSSYPEAVTLFLTHRCNLHCVMCGQWGEGGVTKKQPMQHIREELSVEELKAVIDDISLFKPNITLFGGEPLLHPGCAEIIRYVKQKGMHCLMITNGSLLEGLAGEIVEAGLDELNVSLDAASRLHDEIRGSPGLFAKIMNGLKQINYFKERNNKNKPLINLQCTINKYNYGHLEEMLGVAGDARANSLTFHNLIFLRNELLEKQKEYDKPLGSSSGSWEGFVFDPGINPRELYAKMRQILKGRYSFGVDFYPNLSFKGLEEYYQNPCYMPSEYPARCLSPWIAAYVFPNGDVRPCLNFSYSYGNVRGNKISELWNGPCAIQFRRFLKEKKIFPVCARCTELYRY